MPTIEERIDQTIGEVRTHSLDLSFGEIVNLHSNKELVIQPEYQRLFRWSVEQQSRLIESILLDLPIPQIFVIETEEGVLELVDGLQRVRSVMHFIQSELLDDSPLRLEGCDLIPELNNLLFDDLSLQLRLRIKRSTVRAVMIKRQSSTKLRYEMFKRLNTGGSLLSAQEIRNCTARMIGVAGIEFYQFLQRCSESTSFQTCIETLAESDRDQKGDEELVLRFFALKNAREKFRGSVRDWLDEYMEAVILAPISFDYQSERDTFNQVFEYLARVLGAGAFVRYRGADPIGGLAPAYFEAVTMGVCETLERALTLDDGPVKQMVIQAVQSTEFRSFTGPASNTRAKLAGRIGKVAQAIREIPA